MHFVLSSTEKALRFSINLTLLVCDCNINNDIKFIIMHTFFKEEDAINYIVGISVMLLHFLRAFIIGVLFYYDE